MDCFFAKKLWNNNFNDAQDYAIGEIWYFKCNTIFMRECGVLVGCLPGILEITGCTSHCIACLVKHITMFVQLFWYALRDIENSIFGIHSLNVQ